MAGFVYKALRNPSERRAPLSPSCRQFRRRAQLARSIRVRIPPEVSCAFSRDIAFEIVVLVVRDCDRGCDMGGYCVCG